MKDIQCKTNISLKDYFPKLKKIPYEQYNLIISNNKEKQIIPLKDPENKLFELTSKMTKKDLTYLITLIDSENNAVIGEAYLIVASFRLKKLKEIKKISFEQQVKIDLNKKMKENLFGPGINIGNIYLKLLIDISLCINTNNSNNNIFIYKIENKNKSNNIIGNSGSEYNLSNLSLSSFLTNLSTLKENKKQNEKKIKNISSFNNIKYLSTDISSKHNKNNIKDNNKEENNNKRKMKILSPNKISLKKHRTKWHINREYLKTCNNKNVINPNDKKINTSSNFNIKKINNSNIIKKNKIRKAFSNENIRNKNSNIRLSTEICNNEKKIKSNSKHKKDINKTEKIKQKNFNKSKKIIKLTKNIDNNEIKNNIISIINNIEDKNKEIKNKFDTINSKYLLIKEKLSYEHKINDLIQNEYEHNNMKNFINVNINKQANNILLKQMPKIKLNELNIFKIIFNQKINNKNKIDPKQIIKEKAKQQKQIQVLICLIRNLIKIFGNLSHLFEKDDNKKILIKSLFLRYNIKEKELNEGDDLFDMYEKLVKDKKEEVNYYDKYQKEKEEFNTIKEEDDEDMATIE